MTIKKISIKSLLAKILDEYHTIPAAGQEIYVSTDVSSSNISANNNWYYGTNFTGYSKYQKITSTGERYFSKDTNGFKILRHGIYQIHAGAHFNAAETTNTFGLQIYNYTTQAQVGSSRYCGGVSLGWGSTTTTWTWEVDANTILAPRFIRTTGTGRWKMTNSSFAIILLEDLED